MPPNTNWTGNTSTSVAPTFDSTTTLFDASVPFDGLSNSDRTKIYLPNDTLYTGNLPKNTTWTIPNPL